MKKWLLISLLLLAGCGSDEEIVPQVPEVVAVVPEDIEGIWKLSHIEVTAVDKLNVLSDKCFEFTTSPQSTFEVEKKDFVFSGENVVQTYSYCPEQQISYTNWELTGSDDKFQVTIKDGETFKVIITEQGPGVALTRSFKVDSKQVTLRYEKEW